MKPPFRPGISSLSPSPSPPPQLQTPLLLVHFLLQRLVRCIENCLLLALRRRSAQVVIVTRPIAPPTCSEVRRRRFSALDLLQDLALFCNEVSRCPRCGLIGQRRDMTRMTIEVVWRSLLQPLNDEPTSSTPAKPSYVPRRPQDVEVHHDLPVHLVLAVVLPDGEPVRVV